MDGRQGIHDREELRLRPRGRQRRALRSLCFQEIFTTPYFCTVQDPKFYDTAEEIPDGPTTKRMIELARETGMVIVAPIYEKVDEGTFYNTAAVIDADGSFLGIYRKTHIPQVEGFWEKFYFRPGQPRLSGLRHRRRQDRRLHLLRPPLPRRLAGAGAQGSQDRLQPVGDHPRSLASICGSSSSRRRRWPMSISSGRSTGSAKKN